VPSSAKKQTLSSVAGNNRDDGVAFADAGPFHRGQPADA
jgi:hypothetical protein